MLDTIIACLALNIYFEARDQPIDGQVAVTQVAINRVNDPRFPDSHCEVIKEGPVRNGLPIIGRCQFSWYCDGLRDTPKNQDAYRWAVVVAIGVLDKKYEDLVNGATHYHADYVSPSWSTEKTVVVKIGDHIFYRWEKKK
jgi:spore germination cell wall hydrolase CwlJ-like protein